MDNGRTALLCWIRPGSGRGRGMEPYAFLSYSRDDSSFAVRLGRDLKHRGIQVWFDQLDIPPGSDWDEEVTKALHGARDVLFVVSRTSVASDNVLNEIAFAVEHKKRV